MSRNDPKSSSPAVQRARLREEERELELRQGHTGRVHVDVNEPTGVRVEFDFNAEDIPDTGVDIIESLPLAWVSALLDDGKEPHWSGRGDMRLELQLAHEGALFGLKGTLQVPLSHPCGRCLNDVPFDYSLDVDLRLLEREGEDIPTEEFEADADSLAADDPIEDLDTASFTGGVIHLDAILREQLFLELPMHPTCESPRAAPTAPCAFDEAHVLERERARWVDPRWQGLAALREKLPVAKDPPSATQAPQPKIKETSPPSTTSNSVKNGVQVGLALPPAMPTAAKAAKAVKKVPTAVKKTPTAVKKSPTAVKKTPTAVKKTPTAVKKPPKAVKKPPKAVKKPPKAVKKPPKAVKKAPKAVKKAPKAAKKSPKPAKKAPKAAKKAPKAVKKAPTAKKKASSKKRAKKSKQR